METFECCSIAICTFYRTRPAGLLCLSSFVWVSIVFTIGLNATRVASCAMIPNVGRLQKKWWPHQIICGNLSFNLSPPLPSHFMVFYASYFLSTSFFPSSSFLCPPIFGLNKTGSVCIEALSCNDYCSGKTIIITQHVCVFVAMRIQHAMRIRRIVYPTVHHFSILSHKRHDYRKKSHRT